MYIPFHTVYCLVLLLSKNKWYHIVSVLSLYRGDVEPDNPNHEAEARRLFDGMLQALQDVSCCLCWQLSG